MGLAAAGITVMGAVSDRAEGKAEVRISTAEKMLLKNQFSTDMIAEISGLTVEEVEKLKEKLSA